MKPDELKLQKMFPELRGFEPVDRSSVPSYNDGGNEVTITWEGPGCHYHTKHSDYGVDSRWTTLQKVERYQFKEWRYRPLNQKKYYGKDLN